MKNAAALQKNSWCKRKKFNETGQALEEKRIRRRCPAFMKGRKAQSSLEGGYSEKKQYPLDLMKEGAYLINVGRGSAIDPDALYQALTEGHLGGCGLDVTEPEPLPEDSPLWDLDHVIITPHVAGNFFLAETFERIVRIAGENLNAWANKKPLKNVVNLKAGY